MDMLQSHVLPCEAYMCVCVAWRFHQAKQRLDDYDLSIRVRLNYQPWFQKTGFLIACQVALCVSAKQKVSRERVHHSDQRTGFAT